VLGGHQMAHRVMVFGSKDVVRRLQAAGMTGGALEFVATASAAQGLRALQAEQFDAIIVCLPARDTSPQQLCEQIRDVSQLPLVVLADEPDTDTIVEVLKWGADDCLSSSLSAREIVTHLRAQIRRATQYIPPAELPEQLQVGPLSMDIPRHLATLEGNPLRLTPKEFDLLAYLAQHTGRVVPREEIVTAVWGEQLCASSRSLDVHIGRLRRKIEADPYNPQLLITVPGVGYRLAAP